MHHTPTFLSSSCSFLLLSVSCNCRLSSSSCCCFLSMAASCARLRSSSSCFSLIALALASLLSISSWIRKGNMVRNRHQDMTPMLANQQNHNSLTLACFSFSSSILCISSKDGTFCWLKKWKEMLKKTLIKKRLNIGHFLIGGARKFFSFYFNSFPDQGNGFNEKRKAHP